MTIDSTIFKIGDQVVYPAHGVGVIIDEIITTIAGGNIEMYVIKFNQNKVTCHLPKLKSIKNGLRHISTIDGLEIALDTLRSARNQYRKQKALWSKRSIELKQKLTSGSLKLLAEVLKELYRTDSDGGTAEMSYSEKEIYEDALEQFALEYSISQNQPLEHAKAKILTILEVAS